MGARWSVGNAFWACPYLHIKATDAPDLTQVRSTARMFAGATAMNEDITYWDLSKVSNLEAMFQGATAFNQNLGYWNLASADTLTAMLSGATSFDQKLGNWNLSKVTALQQMLENTNLSLLNYDSTLIRWARHGLSNKNLGSVSPLKYCQALEARTALLARGWILSGDALACSEGAFVTTWITAFPGSSAYNFITIPTTGTGYNYAVDWNNDGIFADRTDWRTHSSVFRAATHA